MILLAAPLLLVLLIVAIAAAAASVGRPGPQRPPVNPYAVLLLTLSFAAMMMTVVSLGVLTHAVADLVSPPSSDTASSPSFRAANPILPQATLLGRTVDEQRNRDATSAVTAGAFAATGLVAFGLVWPRARREGADAAASNLRLPFIYAYLVVGMAAVAILVLVPTLLTFVFRAAAPGVAGTSGRANGLRDSAVAAVLLAAAATIVTSHLRWVAQLRTATPESPPGL